MCTSIWKSFLFHDQPPLPSDPPLIPGDGAGPSQSQCLQNLVVIFLASVGNAILFLRMSFLCLNRTSWHVMSHILSVGKKSLVFQTAICSRVSMVLKTVQSLPASWFPGLLSAEANDPAFLQAPSLSLCLSPPTLLWLLSHQQSIPECVQAGPKASWEPVSADHGLGGDGGTAYPSQDCKLCAVM